MRPLAGVSADLPFYECSLPQLRWRRHSTEHSGVLAVKNFELQQEMQVTLMFFYSK